MSPHRHFVLFHAQNPTISRTCRTERRYREDIRHRRWSPCPINHLSFPEGRVVGECQMRYIARETCLPDDGAHIVCVVEVSYSIGSCGTPNSSVSLSGTRPDWQHVGIGVCVTVAVKWSGCRLQSLQWLLIKRSARRRVMRSSSRRIVTGVT